jgi:periplasmic divalent cation tolerance protein
LTKSLSRNRTWHRFNDEIEIWIDKNFHLVYPFFMLIIFTTTPTIDEAENLATCLIEQKLAACVQILPKMKSFYFWEGKVQKDEEFLLLVKTSNANFNQVESFIKANHSYENPEIVAVAAYNVSAEYNDWIRLVTNS